MAIGSIAYLRNLAWKGQLNMATRQEQLLTILDHLSSNGGSDITGAVVVSMDGIVLASRVSNDTSPS